MTIDLSPILSAFTASDIVSGVFSVAVTLASVYMMIYAAVNILMMLRGGDGGDWKIGSNLAWLAEINRDAEFKKRYQRERKSAEYREWKKAKKL